MRADAKKNYAQLLAVARDVVTEDGAEASLRDIARRAGVGFGTLYRHFPSREALLDALLRESFDALTVRAAELEATQSSGEALVTWLHEAVAVAHNFRGAIEAMVAAIADEGSALHASCQEMHAAGGRLLARAQAEGTARTDLDGTDFFALLSALAWLRDQPALQARADHLFDVIAGAILTKG
ncbi:TetR/AcrR family transcriptional regulator [Afifella marina]|uniref:Transcriptional regulator, TetR family n=1 Tax=Afifella marina DSM 2698 TaxID=1120955 RepID=A0A1G5MXG3_AFIMA|nr:TetR/AcrR family transcriptional regulator [Afifella marina]MBK1622073.1 TetR/AcrR family transcriptional regulator [Afifella marina DSM 2698]MBK1627866.1 TetR/AcrR family transcriptional regulator [Afifella marina]MBK5918069.1 TetR family transcriptional regulator [Afifella marina]RAI19845.1 TetR family transcriptional regulator [Afifella marina DSM 2698]SCZ29241.1 transcriptional regulator, TetR family [Afifella marina DSM 2698]